MEVHYSLSLPELESLLRTALFGSLPTLRFEVSSSLDVTLTTRPTEEWEVAAVRSSREGVWTSVPWASTAQLNEIISWALLESRLCNPNIAPLVDIQVTAEKVACCRALEGQSIESREFSETAVAQLVVDVSGAMLYANSLSVAFEELSASAVVERDGQFVVGGVRRGDSTNHIGELAHLIQQLPTLQYSGELQALLDSILSGELSLLQANTRAFSLLTPHIPSAHCEELICFTSRRMLTFDFSNRDWHKSVFLSHPILYLECSRCVPYSSALLAICGLSNNELRGSCVVNRQGGVEALPNTVHGRGYAGLVACEGLLYAFGGWNPSSSKAYLAVILKSAERIHPQTDTQWQELPSMAAGHSCFNPVCWLHCIFLCGGNTHALEQFHPHSLTYSLLAWRLPEGLGPALTVLDGSSVVVVTSNTLCTVLPSLVLQSLVHERNYPYSNACPVLREGGIHFTQEIKWLELDCRTGDLRV